MQLWSRTTFHHLSHVTKLIALYALYALSALSALCELLWYKYSDPDDRGGLFSAPTELPEMVYPEDLSGIASNGLPTEQLQSE